MIPGVAVKWPSQVERGRLWPSQHHPAPARTAPVQPSLGQGIRATPRIAGRAADESTCKPGTPRHRARPPETRASEWPGNGRGREKAVTQAAVLPPVRAILPPRTRRSMDTSIKRRLRSAAMRATAVSVGAVVLLAAAVSASAATIGSSDEHAPAAAPSRLSRAIKALEPYVYWPMNSHATPEADGSGNSRPGLTKAGAGPTVLLTSPSNPPGGSGGSVAFRPGGRQSGQYLQSSPRPVPYGTRGTLVAWFKVNRTLPTWTQTVVVDNGATSGYGAGFFITTTGRLQLGDSSAIFDPIPTNFGPRKRTLSGPLNDGRWHMVAYVDQYNVYVPLNGHPQPRDQWKPSLIYLDGQLVDGTVDGTLLDLYGDSGKARLLVGAGQSSQASSLGKLEGNVSNVALFDKLLNDKQIAAIWAAGN